MTEAGAEVRASEAERGVRYTCPDCQVLLTPRLGSVRVPHFSHKAEAAICDFRYETEEHYRAKMAIVQAVESGMPVRLLRLCPLCQVVTETPLPAAVCRATSELTLSTNHRADVALLDAQGEVVAAIEVLMHHPVDDEKGQLLAAHGVPWVEVRALEVLDADQPIWRLTQDFFPEFVCHGCLDARQQAAEAFRVAFEERQAIRFIRRCRTCQQPRAHPIPTGIAAVELGRELRPGIKADVALIGEHGRPRAFIELAPGRIVTSERLEALKSTRLPWAVIPASFVLNEANRYDWGVAHDEFNRFTCSECKLDAWRERHEHRTEAEERAFIDAHAATQSWASPQRQQVACPAPGFGLVDPLRACVVCPYFMDAEPNGILCFGRAARADAGQASIEPSDGV